MAEWEGILTEARVDWEGRDVNILRRVYGDLDVIDYGPARPGQGLLLSVGSGMMMAVMDRVLPCRWCVDLSGGAKVGAPALLSWMLWLHRRASFVVVAGWFTITHPGFLVPVLRVWSPEDVLVYTPNVELGYGTAVFSLDALAREAWRMQFRQDRLREVSELRAQGRLPGADGRCYPPKKSDTSPGSPPAAAG